MTDDTVPVSTIREVLGNMINIQKKCLTDEYMRGMCNGLICARAVLLDGDAKFITAEDMKSDKGGR